MADDQAKAQAKATVLFENEHEFDTESIVRIDDEYYYRKRNGGYGGAWQGRHSECTAVSRTEARRLALAWGEPLEKVAEVLS